MILESSTLLYSGKIMLKYSVASLIMGSFILWSCREGIQNFVRSDEDLSVNILAQKMNINMN